MKSGIRAAQVGFHAGLAPSTDPDPLGGLRRRMVACHVVLHRTSHDVCTARRLVTYTGPLRFSDYCAGCR